MKAKGREPWRHPGFPQGGRIPSQSGSRGRPAVQPRGGSDAAGADFLFHQPPEILKPSGDDAWSDVFRPRHGRELFRQGRSFRRGGQQVVQDGVHLIRPFRGGVRHAGERLARMFLIKKAPGSGAVSQLETARAYNPFPAPSSNRRSKGGVSVTGAPDGRMRKPLKFRSSSGAA